MHDRGAFTQVSAQAHTSGVADADAGGHHVIGHFGEFVHAVDGQRTASEARLQAARGQLFDIDGAFVGPGDVAQQAEHAGQVQAVRLH